MPFNSDRLNREAKKSEERIERKGMSLGTPFIVPTKDDRGNDDILIRLNPWKGYKVSEIYRMPEGRKFLRYVVSPNFDIAIKAKRAIQKLIEDLDL